MDEYMQRARISDFHDHIPRGAKEVFEAMDKKDLAFTVIAALKLLKKQKRMPYVERLEKNDHKSEWYRVEGNKALAEGSYQKALILYNKALLYALPLSRCAKLALGNRSALSHKVKAYASSMADIDRVMRIGCPDDVLEKLKSRLDDCRKKLWIGEAIDVPRGSGTQTFAIDRYFEIASTNTEIASISQDIGFINENEIKTVAASRDIKVGTIVGAEVASITQCNDANKYLSCNYCNKFSVALIACQSCTKTLFCDEICMEMANDEYHEIECCIVDVLKKVPINVRMALKAAIKIKNQCKTWDSFITLSFDYGMEKIQNSTISEIYNEDSPCSLLCVNDDRHMVHGPMYNMAFDIAVVIHYLDRVPMYLPKAPAKKTIVISAFGRIMLALAMYSVPTLMPLITDDNGEIVCHKSFNYGWFALTSKLKNSCNPNVLPLMLYKEVLLIAIQPIRRGSEITIPYLGHWLDNPMSKFARNRSMFALTGKFCECVICSRDMMMEYNYTSTDVQYRNLRRLRMNKIKRTFSLKTLPVIYPKLCKALSFFSTMPFSKEYKEIYKLFRKCLHFYQTLRYPQFMIESYDEELAYSMR